MEKKPTKFQRPICYLLDKLFTLTMIFFYGRSPSESKGEKVTRWMVLLLIVIGVLLLFYTIRKMFRPTLPPIYIP